MQAVAQLVLAIDIHDLVHSDVNTHHTGPSHQQQTERAAVLIFAPGFGEIQGLIGALQPWAATNASHGYQRGGGNALACIQNPRSHLTVYLIALHFISAQLT
jgi:hypothetical protein